MESSSRDAELAYRKPPIIEAVIEQRFSVPMSEGELERVRHEFKGDYPAIREFQELSVALRSGRSTPVLEPTDKKYELVKKDVSATLIITGYSIAYAQLAPYPGWEVFLAEAIKVFRVVRRVVGHRPLSRIGVRYINRLDIPTNLLGREAPNIMTIGDFLLVHPEYPEGVLPPLQGAKLQCVFFLADIKSQLTITSATVQSPVPNHSSLAFDMDISRTIDVPQRNDEIVSLLNEIRIRKNDIFEGCITKRMKEIFK